MAANARPTSPGVSLEDASSPTSDSASQSSQSSSYGRKNKADRKARELSQIVQA